MFGDFGSVIGRMLITAGIIFLVIGLIFVYGPKIPFIGKLSGDFHYKGERFQFYFPFVTCIILSIILTLIINIFFRR